jgi:hypothetical protein
MYTYSGKSQHRRFGGAASFWRKLVLSDRAGRALIVDGRRSDRFHLEPGDGLDANLHAGQAIDAATWCYRAHRPLSSSRPAPELRLAPRHRGTPPATPAAAAATAPRVPWPCLFLTDKSHVSLWCRIIRSKYRPTSECRSKLYRSFGCP